MTSLDDIGAELNALEMSVIPAQAGVSPTAPSDPRPRSSRGQALRGDDEGGYA